MKSFLKTFAFTIIGLSLLTGCGEETVYDKEVPIITSSDYEGLSNAERKQLYSKRFKEIQDFVNSHREELGEQDFDKLRTVLTGKGIGGKLPEGTTVGDILGKNK